MKSLSAAFTALSLALAATSASAAPVSLSFSNDSILSNGVSAATFDDVYTFVLAGQATLGVLITTHSPEPHPNVDITSAFLKSGSTVFALTELNGVDWEAEEPQPDVETWSMDPLRLAGGSWELHVVGRGFGVKWPEGYTAQLSGRTAEVPPTELPEPTALALLATALAALGLSRRRAH